MITSAPEQFDTREEAIALVEASDLFLSEAQLSQSELTGAAHVHPYDVEIYVLNGIFELHDLASDQVHRLERGSRATVPAGTLHAETAPGTFHAVFGVSADPRPLMAERQRTAS